MRTAKLQDLLLQYNSIDPKEQVYKQQMLDMLRLCPNSFHRGCIPGHFTASAWLLNKDSTEVLMLHHAKLDKWLQLGGHCDGDTDVLQVAIKEASEESGLSNIEPVFETIFDLDIHLIPQFKDDTPHYHYDVRFLLQAKGSSEFIRNNEAKDLKWFGKDINLLPTKSLSVTRMFDKWVNL